MRRALLLAVDQWHGAPALAKIANVRTVGGVVFPGSPLAATKEELQQLAGFWPDIEKSRAEGKRLLKEAGAEGLTFELLNRNVDQPYKYVGTWLIDEWSKVGLHASQRVVPTGPWFEGCEAAISTSSSKPAARASSTRCSMCRRLFRPRSSPRTTGTMTTRRRSNSIRKCCTSPTRRRSALMRDFEKHVVDGQAHELPMLWWCRIIPYRSYVKGWKISPSHYLNQDLSTVWLDK